MTRSLGAWFGILVRGMAMGIAEVVPGVSGGTIALVSGIYDEFIDSLAKLGPDSLRVLFADGVGAFWRHQNMTFLVVLASGMLLSVLIFAQLMSRLLASVPTVVWGFFFGLVAYSVVQLAREINMRSVLIFGSLGLLGALVFLQLPPLPTQDNPLIFLLGGALAVSAWMLPAVSGSYLLLVLGLYQAVLDALTKFDWVTLTALLSGCALGLLLFAKLLNWVIRTHRNSLLGFLTGFMAGSLIKLWPWQIAQGAVSPSAYEQAVQAPAMIGAAVIAAMLGAVALLGLSRLKK